MLFGNPRTAMSDLYIYVRKANAMHGIQYMKGEEEG
jgi:hypothetical protein